MTKTKRQQIQGIYPFVQLGWWLRLNYFFIFWFLVYSFYILFVFLQELSSALGGYGWQHRLTTTITCNGISLKPNIITSTLFVLQTL